MAYEDDNIKVIEYNNLTELLLKVIKRRPGMFLGEAKISLLPTFIIGYRFAYRLCQKSEDEYFGENGFLEWMDRKHKMGRPSYWTTFFLDRSEDDEKNALELYFTYLEEYYTEINNRKTNK